MADVRKSKPTVASFVTYVDFYGVEHPALVHSVPDEGLNLYVFNGAIDPLKIGVPERQNKDALQVWHR